MSAVGKIDPEEEAQQASEREELRPLFTLTVGATCLGGETRLNGLGWGDFQEAFGIDSNAPLIKRMYDLIDPDGVGCITFDRFADVLYPLYSKHATFNDRLSFLFRCFDLDGSGTISRSELFTGLEATMKQHGVPKEMHEAMVNSTFSAFGAEHDDEISWTLFYAYYDERPREAMRTIRRLGVDVKRVLVDLWMRAPGSWLERQCGPHQMTLVLERGSAQLAS